MQCAGFGDRCGADYSAPDAEIMAIQDQQSQSRQPQLITQLPIKSAEPARSRLPGIRFRLFVAGALAALVLAIYRASWSMTGALVALMFVTGLGLILRHVALLRRKNSQQLAELETLRDHTWELRESEERYRSLAEAFGDLVVHRDPAGRILFANDAFVDTFGIEIGRLNGSMAFHLEPLNDTSTPLADAGKDNPCARDLLLKTLNGDRWFSWLDLDIRNEQSGQAAIISVARDITERKEYEAALQQEKIKAESANMAKSRFLATVSHEIRTPLNGILGMANLLKGTKLAPAQQTYVDAVATSGRALFALVEDILDITKIEADRLELYPEPTNITAVCEDLIELLANTAHAKNIEIASYIGPNVPTEIVVDRGRLRQVILNIAGNAVKFTEKGGVALRITSRCQNLGQNQVKLRFEIEDTGPGLAEADKERIFREFEQLDDVRSRRHNGVGLGLSISRRIIRKMGGLISVDSQQGVGSRFWFEIEVPVSAGEIIRPPAEPATRQVLLVAPDGIERSIVAETIDDHGYPVLQYSSIGEMLKTRENEQPLNTAIGTIIVDHRLRFKPQRLVGKVKRTFTPKPRLIALVDPATRSSVEQLRNCGFDGWLMRPVRVNSLINVLSGEKESTAEAHAQDGASTELTGPQDNHHSRLKILLAEDNPINQLLARTLMERAGHKVTVTDDGHGAVAAFQAQVGKKTSFDLVLMDLHMPDMDGLEAMAIIRKMEKKNKLPKAPILVLSADEQREMRERVIKAGGSGFLSKPIDAEQLSRAVKIVTSAS